MWLCSKEIIEKMILSIIAYTKATAIDYVQPVLLELFAVYASYRLDTGTKRQQQLQQQQQMWQNGVETTNAQQQMTGLHFIFLIPDPPLYEIWGKAITRIGQLLKYVSNPNPEGTEKQIPTTFGTIMKPLGMAKIRLLELVESSMNANHGKIITFIEQSDLMANILVTTKN